MDKDKIETRHADACYESLPKLEIRQEKDQPPKIVGYAAVFNSWSKDIGGFIERIVPGAFNKAIQESDARALFNHDRNYVLGRQSAGTLRMKEDDKGLYVEIDPPPTQWANDLVTSIRRGDIAEQSFGFTVKTDEWSEIDGKATRTIREFERVYDVSIVTFPAYPETSAAVRSMEEWRSATKGKGRDGGTNAPDPMTIYRYRLGLREKQIKIDKE